MTKNTDISDFISELISKGYSSIKRENGKGKLKAFKEIDKGLGFLKDNAEVHSEDVSKSIVILRLLVNLREDIIQSKHVMDHQIPNIYTSVDKLNTLLIKSANQSLKNDDPNLITNQCEEFLNAADEIRKDEKLKGIGVLDGRLKNVIGRLRKKSTIESIFSDQDLDQYHTLIEEADDVLQDGSLNQIGSKFLDLKQTIDKMSEDFPYRNRLTKYVRRFEKSFHLKLKSKANALVKKSNGASIFDNYEILDELLSMKNLEDYHHKKGLTIMIRKFYKKIEKTKIVPPEKALHSMREFILEHISHKHWQSYEKIFEKKYHSNELFSESFYDSTLKAFSPFDASVFLKNQLEKLKKIDLKDRRHITLEQDFVRMLEKLLTVFDSLAVKKTSKKKSTPSKQAQVV